MGQENHLPASMENWIWRFIRQENMKILPIGRKTLQKDSMAEAPAAGFDSRRTVPVPTLVSSEVVRLFNL